jgi:hypothetical protein
MTQKQNIGFRRTLRRHANFGELSFLRGGTYCTPVRQSRCFAKNLARGSGGLCHSRGFVGALVITALTLAPRHLTPSLTHCRPCAVRYRRPFPRIVALVVVVSAGGSPKPLTSLTGSGTIGQTAVESARELKHKDGRPIRNPNPIHKRIA